MSDRQILPQRRYAETFDLVHGEHRTRYKITVGYFRPNNPAEVFITGAKAGSDLEAVARDGAVLLSLAMQFGIPLTVIRGAMTRNEDGSPSTVIGAVVEQLVVEAK